MLGPLSPTGEHRRPVIGVSTYVERASWGAWNRDCALLPTTYFRNVDDAGAIPVLLPPSRHAEDAVQWLDGLILAGGPDVDAALYGAQPHPSADRPRRERDTWELRLASAAQARGIPVLGICRGMQLLNVAHGGDLIQALEECQHGELHRPTPGVFGRHDVRIDAQSWCGAALGPTTEVATYHHQAINNLGAGLRATAWASDGCVEAFESTDGNILIGVQWHPEEDRSNPLIKEFVTTCAALIPTHSHLKEAPRP